MTRTILPLLAGTALGAAATYALLGSRTHDPSALSSAASGTEGAAPRVAQAPGGADDAPLPASQREAVYRLAAGADERTLRRLLDEAAELPPSPARSFTLDALLVRYMELDPSAGIRQARELRVGADTLAALFQVWAAADSDAALRALRSVDDRGAMHDIALALIDVPGGDEATAARLADALPGVDATELLAEVVARGAVAAPADAFERALALDDTLATQSALRQIGEAWARQDPEAALARSASIEDPRRRAAFEDGALREWARTDAGAAFEHLLSSGGGIRRALGAPVVGFSPWSGNSALADIARRDPIRVLDSANRLPQPLNMIMPQVALDALAETDPLRAIRYAEAAPGASRQSYLQAAAGAWGRRDPEAALEWARGTAPNDRNLLSAVVRGLRDAALTAVLRAAMLNGRQGAEAPLLDAFSSDEAGQQALLLVIMERMRRDPVAGRALIDEHLTDPELRRRAEQAMEAGRNGRNIRPPSVNRAIGVFPAVPQGAVPD